MNFLQIPAEAGGSSSTSSNTSSNASNNAAAFPPISANRRKSLSLFQRRTTSGNLNFEGIKASLGSISDEAGGMAGGDSLSSMQSIAGGPSRRKSFLLEQNLRRASYIDPGQRDTDGGYALPSLGSFRKNRQNRGEEEEDMNTSVELTVDSTVSDFKAYHKKIAHPATIIKITAPDTDREVYTEFDLLSNEILSVMGDLESSLEDLTNWKDDFLKQSVPSNVKLQLATLFSRMLRSKSDLHEPIFELVRQIKLYSRPWLNKKNSLVELEKEYQRHSMVLDVAIRKLETIQNQIDHVKSEHRVALWERLTSRLFDYLPMDLGIQNKRYASVLKFKKIRISMFAKNANLRQARSQRNSLKELNQNEKLVKQETALEISKKLEKELEDKKKSDEFKKLRESIQEYIVDDPPMIAKLKELVSIFKKLLLQMHPKFSEQWPSLLSRPFPSNPTVSYFSFKTGTIVNQGKRKIPLKSYSLVDLRCFSRDQVKRKQESESDSELETSREINFWNDGSKLYEIASIPRSNSEHALYAMGPNAQLRREIQLPLDEKEKTRITDSIRKPELEDTGKIDWDSEDENSSILSLEEDYLQELQPQDLQDAIDEFFAKNPKKTSNDIDPNIEMDTEENLLEKMDAKKDFFSLQEVVELTLLHAQQVHLLQKQYEHKLDQMTETMGSLEKRNEETVKELKSKIRNLETNQKSEPSISKKNSTAFTDDGEPSLVSESRAMTPKKKSKKKQTKSPKSKSRASSADKSKSRVQSASKVKKEKETPVNLRTPVVIPKGSNPETKTPTHMTMSFMDRLRWFTELALRKREETRKKFLQAEIAANEEKLLYSRQIQDIPSTKMMDPSVQLGYIPATFMPMPGSVPSSKVKSFWSEQGIHSPWGGRFKNTPKTSQDDEKLNILNLFDVAMRTAKPLANAQTVKKDKE